MKTKFHLVNNIRIGDKKEELFLYDLNKVDYFMPSFLRINSSRLRASSSLKF